MPCERRGCDAYQRRTSATIRESVGGTLVEEFLAVPRTPGVGQRLIDAVILPNGPHRVARASEVDLKGQDVIVVQTKASRLGMYLMCQALSSAELIRSRFQPASVRAVIVCTADDLVLRPLLDPFPYVQVVVMDAAQQRVAADGAAPRR
jgi:hypothetical protein